MTCKHPDIAPAVLYSGTKCTGNTIRLDLEDDPVKGVSYFNKQDLSHLGMDDNFAGAVMIPAGFSLFLYDDDEMEGTPIKMDGKENDEFGMVC